MHGGLPNYLLKDFSNDEEALKQLTKELNEYFENQFVFVFNNHYDCFLLDDSIKQLVKDDFRFTSFDSMTNSAKKTLYRDFPERKLLDWASI